LQWKAEFIGDIDCDDPLKYSFTSAPEC